jgi:hypothetical protein
MPMTVWEKCYTCSVFRSFEQAQGLLKQQIGVPKALIVGLVQLNEKLFST